MRRFAGVLAPLVALLGRVFPWPLVRLGSPRWSVAASAAVLGGWTVSRFLLLANGPWEQDEALLASGVIDFDLSRHAPLPPGFPLWIAAGKAVRHLGVADPVLALQLASAALSVLGLWALVAVWERAAGRRLAVAGACLAAFLPGVWFHAGRALSETPSAALTIVALACWRAAGFAGFTPGLVLLAAAALVRPPLAPWLVVVALAGCWWVREQPRRLASGVSWALALTVAVMVPAIAAAGGTDLWLAVSRQHASEHFGLLGVESARLADLGLVRALGGVVPAAAALVAGLLGWIALRSRLSLTAWAWGSLSGAWIGFLLVFLHNRTTPRYWTVALLLLATPIVTGIGAVVRRERVTVTVAAVVTAVSAAAAWPAIVHVHRHRLPVVAAIDRVASAGRCTLVFEDQLFSFRNLAQATGALAVDSVRLGDAPHARRGVGLAPVFLLVEGDGQDVSSPSSDVVELVCDVPSVRRLSQERFLRARLVRDPVAPVLGAQLAEFDGLDRFVWCRSHARFLAPAVAWSGRLLLVVEPHPAALPAVLAARVGDGETTGVALRPGRQLVAVPFAVPRDNSVPLVVDLVASREVQLAGDGRPIAFRVFAAFVEAEPHGTPPRPFVPDLHSALAAFSTTEGVFNGELLGDPPRAAAWTGGRAVIRVPAGPWMMGVELFAPRPLPARVRLALGSAVAELTVGKDPQRVVLPIPPEFAPGRPAELVVTSDTFRPGSGDARELGVAIGRIDFVPAPPPRLPVP